MVTCRPSLAASPCYGPSLGLPRLARRPSCSVGVEMRKGFELQNCDMFPFGAPLNDQSRR